jgi:hypothetical protein
MKRDYQRRAPTLRIMAFRIRALFSLALTVAFIFVIAWLLLLRPGHENTSAFARGVPSGRQYFTGGGTIGLEVSGSRPTESSIEFHAEGSTARRPPRITQQDALPSEQLVEPEIKRPGDVAAPAASETSPVASAESRTNPFTEGWTSSSSSHTAHVDDIRLLIGVMSPWWQSARRHMIRHAYRELLKVGLPVDVVFVQGNLTSSINPNNLDKVMEMQRTVIGWENSTYHDLMHLDCVENLEHGKTYEYLKKVGLEFQNVYTHVMKTDDDSFVNIPGIYHLAATLTAALVDVLRENRHQRHFYWGTTWTEEYRQHEEMWGSGYILSMDLVKWISESDIAQNNQWGYEDYQVCYWLLQGGLDDNYVVNRTAFAGYPWPELGDYTYKQENDVRPFDRWTLVTHPLKEDFMWVDTANYYLSLEWPQRT